MIRVAKIIPFFISGITPFTTIDYPGCLSAVLFCQGCSWRCGYCHNPHLQPFGKPTIKWEQVIEFLQKRRKLLDAVVFSGGEPSLQIMLPYAMQQVREMGFKIGLHTAGIHPRGLKRALPWIDWVGMDIKAPFETYEKITKSPNSGENARECVQLILDSGVDYEFRTTLHPSLLTPTDLDRMSDQLVQMGVKRYVIQRFRPEGCQEESLNEVPHEIVWDEKALCQLKERFESFLLR